MILAGIDFTLFIKCTVLIFDENRGTGVLVAAELCCLESRMFQILMLTCWWEVANEFVVWLCLQIHLLLYLVNSPYLNPEFSHFYLLDSLHHSKWEERASSHVLHSCLPCLNHSCTIDFISVKFPLNLFTLNAEELKYIALDK